MRRPRDDDVDGAVDRDPRKPCIAVEPSPGLEVASLGLTKIEADARLLDGRLL
jgi:hypothetical protein